MKARKNELDVDFIGGEGPLTKEQEKLVSDFIKSRKATATTPQAQKKSAPTTAQKAKA